MSIWIVSQITLISLFVNLTDWINDSIICLRLALRPSGYVRYLNESLILFNNLLLTLITLIHLWIWLIQSQHLKWSDVWPSMVTHIRNLCSAFNPSKCTHTAVNTHTPWTHTRSSGQPMLRGPGSSWGFSALLKCLTSVVVFNNSFQCSSQCLTVLCSLWTNLSIEPIIFKESVEPFHRYKGMIQLWIQLIWLHQSSSKQFNDMFETR